MSKKEKKDKKKKNKRYEANPLDTFYNMYQNAVRQADGQMSREEFETLFDSYRKTYLDSVAVETAIETESGKKAKKGKKDKKDKKDKKKQEAAITEAPMDATIAVSDDNPAPVWDPDLIAALYAENVAGNQIAKRLDKAEAMLQKPEELALLLDRVDETLHSLKMMQMNLRLKTNNTMCPENYEAVDRIMEKAPALMELMRSYQSGAFTAISEDGLVGIVASFIYLEDDDTLIPDTIPAIGYLDDLSVLKLAERVAEADLDAYNAWKAADNSVD